MATRRYRRLMAGALCIGGFFALAAPHAWRAFWDRRAARLQVGFDSAAWKAYGEGRGWITREHMCADLLRRQRLAGASRLTIRDVLGSPDADVGQGREWHYRLGSLSEYGHYDDVFLMLRFRGDLVAEVRLVPSWLLDKWSIDRRTLRVQ